MKDEGWRVEGGGWMKGGCSLSGSMLGPHAWSEQGFQRVSLHCFTRLIVCSFPCPGASLLSYYTLCRALVFIMEQFQQKSSLQACFLCNKIFFKLSGVRFGFWSFVGKKRLVFYENGQSSACCGQRGNAEGNGWKNGLATASPLAASGANGAGMLLH